MTTLRAGSLVHVEFASDDPGRTRRFLADVFGWEFQETPVREYYVFATPTGPGGAVTKCSEERPTGLLDYILSTDIERDLRRVEQAGGKVRRGKTEVPNLGWWALIEEPTGTPIALFESSSADRGPIARYRYGP